MPKQGNTVEECLLVEWRVREGDPVKKGDILCAIETDKASFEVESTADGVVLKLLAQAGDLVPVLTDIAMIGEAREKVGGATSTASPAVKNEPAAAPAREKKAETTAPEAGVPVAAAPAPMSAARAGSAPVSPRARKLADRLGIDAAGIPGTGVNGRVTSRDVQAAIDSGAAKRATPLAREEMREKNLAPVAATGFGGIVRARDLAGKRAGGARSSGPEKAPEIVPYKGIRKLIGDRMHASLMDHAQLTLNSSADASGMMALRKAIKEHGEAFGLPKITFNDMIAWVAARLLPEFPDINALFDKNAATITRYYQARIGIAIDTPRGLMVPVIPDAHLLSLAEVSSTIARYAEDCRKGSINPDLLSGGTFTISNMGSLGVESFTPVLNSPQVALLGVCAIRDAPVKTSDGFAFQPRIGLSLTIDHRAVDGAPGGRFLRAMVEGIENIGASLSLLGAF
jgi:pyruvate dehydrogenase E2 component (dihydrolipoamide acetyltransferase)